MKDYEMPIGFSMALAQNPQAMEKFSTFDEEQKKRVIRGTHSVNSREEMHRYVDSIAKGAKG